LSATPVREYDDYFETRIAKVLGHILYEYTLEEAIHDGVLANLRTVNIRIPLTLYEQEKYESLSKKIGKAFAMNNEGLAQNYLRQRSAVSNSAKFRVPTAVNVVDSNRGKRCVVFFESIEQLKKAESLLQAKKHLVVSYHSKISPQMRRSNLRLFRRGIFDVLLACRALDEGFNVPEAEIAVIAASTSSNRQRVQRIGRVLRALPGKLDGEVVTLYATDLEQDRLIQETKALNLEASTVWKEVNA
jgi:superfamily II DNA or RNA helicase